LKKAVNDALHLKVVKTQTNMLSRFIDGVDEIDFARDHKLLLSAAEHNDAKNAPMMHSQNRKANTHMFYNSWYDDNIKPYHCD
jgi:hypothetical protein